VAYDYMPFPLFAKQKSQEVTFLKLHHLPKWL